VIRLSDDSGINEKFLTGEKHRNTYKEFEVMDFYPYYIDLSLSKLGVTM